MENKTAKGSLFLANSRLFKTDSSTQRVYDKFKKRRDEIEELKKITDKIEAYLESNKKALLVQKSECEKKIHKIRMENTLGASAKKVQRSRAQSSASSGKNNNYQASYVSDEDEDSTVPDERDWKKDIQNLRKVAGEFNITNYVHILTEQEKKTYDKVIRKVPEANRVYI